MHPKITVKECSNSLVSRRLIYEEDGELKLFETPEELSFGELIERFERAKGLRDDANDAAPEPERSDDL